MKTKNAFAFRNFDEQRILSRPYFRQFRADCHVEDGLTDEEILQSLDATDDDSFDKLEQKLQTVKKAYEQLDFFYRFIWRHLENRVDQYNKSKAEKIGVSVLELVTYQANQRPAPVNDYAIAQLRCRDLMKKFQKFYYELEDKIEKRYRAEFAARLKKLRQAAGLTQKQLGDIIQISPQGFSMYEAARREPTITSLFRLAKILPIDKLLGQA